MNNDDQAFRALAQRAWDSPPGESRTPIQLLLSEYRRLLDTLDAKDRRIVELEETIAELEEAIENVRDDLKGALEKWDT